MNGAQVETLTVGEGGSLQASGSVAMRMMQVGFKASALRTNDVLKNRDWIDVDNAVVQVARQRLVAVADLLNNGLRYPVANALGITRVEWERVSDMGTADVNMSGVAKSDSDRVLYDLVGVPLPIVHKDFNINIRALMASRNAGQPLDTTQVALATKIVTEKLEDIVFNGAGTFGAGQTVYGYLTAPNAYTTALTYDWSNAATTGVHKLSDLLNIIDGLQSKNMSGPYMVYMPLAWHINLLEDYAANYPLSQLARLKQIPGIIDIKPSQNLTDKLVVVQFTQDVVDMIEGMQPTAVSWESPGGFVVNFKVMAIMVPRMKSSYTSQSGIAHCANGATTP